MTVILFISAKREHLNFCKTFYDRVSVHLYVLPFGSPWDLTELVIVKAENREYEIRIFKEIIRSNVSIGAQRKIIV